MMYACRQWSEGVGGYDAIDEVDEVEPHSHYGDDPSPNYEEHQRDQRAGAHAASGLLFDEDAQLHFALADPCFHTPSLPPIPSRSRPLPRPRPASRAPVSATANTLTFLALTIGWLSESPADFEANSNAWIHIGGWLGLLTAVAAWYTSFAGVVNFTFKRVAFPTFPRA